MSNTVSSAELDEQHVELLPARTVLSVFTAVGEGATDDGGSAVVDLVKTFAGIGSSAEGPSGSAESGDKSS